MRVVEYDPSRRADVADLMGLVWGERPAEEELAWFYERNPVRPASVLLAEEDGKTVATAAISFVRMSIGDESLEVGMPLRVATDPAYRGRGIFAELEARNEERVRDLGIRLLLTVPNAASAPVFLNKLGWKPLPPLRVWARRAPAPAPAARQAGRAVRPGPDRLPGRARPRAARLRLAQLAFRRLADGVHAGRGRGVRRRRAPWALRRRRGRRGRVPAGRGCRDGRPHRDRRAPAVAVPALHLRRLRADAPHVHGARQGARSRRSRFRSGRTSSSGDLDFL